MDEQRIQALRKSVMFDPTFLGLYGSFHGAFGVLDLVVDIGIGKLLSLGSEETHIITTAIDFSRRAQMLMDLVRLKDHPQKDVVIAAIQKIQQEAKRNAFAHSYLSASEHVVTFVHRHRENTLKPKRHNYTREEFRVHVESFMKTAADLETALGITQVDFDAFFLADASEAQSETTSPVPPSSKA